MCRIKIKRDAGQLEHASLGGGGLYGSAAAGRAKRPTSRARARQALIKYCSLLRASFASAPCLSMCPFTLMYGRCQQVAHRDPQTINRPCDGHCTRDSATRCSSAPSMLFAPTKLQDRHSQGLFPLQLRQFRVFFLGRCSSGAAKCESCTGRQEKLDTGVFQDAGRESEQGGDR